VGIEVGVIRASIRSSKTELWAATTASVLAELALSQGIALQLGGGAAFPIERYQFRLNQGSPLHTPSKVSPRAAVGVVFRVP
jgi:hypothetical protein